MHTAMDRRLQLVLFLDFQMLDIYFFFPFFEIFIIYTCLQND